jgi:hypothetical protein
MCLEWANLRVLVIHFFHFVNHVVICFKWDFQFDLKHYHCVSFQIPHFFAVNPVNYLFVYTENNINVSHTSFFLKHVRKDGRQRENVRIARIGRIVGQRWLMARASQGDSSRTNRMQITFNGSSGMGMPNFSDMFKPVYITIGFAPFSSCRNVFHSLLRDPPLLCWPLVFWA